MSLIANPAMWDGSYQKAAKPERERPWWSSIPYASTAQMDDAETWAFIKRCFIAAGATCVAAPIGCDGPLDLDHKIRKGQGGKSVPENAQLLCRAHHEKKHGVPQWSKRDAS